MVPRFRRDGYLVVLIGVILAPLLSADLRAEIFHVTPAGNWFERLTNPTMLAPGDELVFGAGTYSTNSRISVGHQGLPANPITIRAEAGANVVLTRPNANQNVVNMEGAQYLTLQGFEITGGSIGIRIDQKDGDPAKFITLDGNHIHHTGDAAVTANFPGRQYEGMHFVRNEIHDTNGTGEGFYLGCNNNACQFFDGIIENNYIHDLDAVGVTQGDGIEIKDGSYNNIVRDNVIHDTNYPGIIAYGVEEQGARNIIEGNVVWNSGDHAIQVAADAIVRNNLVFSSNGDGIHSQIHQGAVPGNLTIVNNTIRTDGNAIDIAPIGTLSGPIEIANNALYPAGGKSLDLPSVSGITVLGNVGDGAATPAQPAAAYLNNGNLSVDFVGFDNRNAFPTADSKLLEIGDELLQPATDFNGLPRAGSNDVGAYRFDPAGNSGWSVSENFKAVGASGDFNHDGALGCADVDSLVAAIAVGTSAAVFDLNGDNLLARDDLTVWLDIAGQRNLSAGQAYLPGDATLDGIVDGADFDRWNASRFTATAAWCSGDFNADGFVDVSDFDNWSMHRTNALATQVPEPDIALWTLVVFLWCCRQTQRRLGRLSIHNQRYYPVRALKCETALRPNAARLYPPSSTETMRSSQASAATSIN